MAIKGGDLIHVGNMILIDRAQTAGPGDVTINREKIYELGNYYSLGSVLDTPDMSFSLESYDVSAEFESILLGQKFNAVDATQTVTVTGGPSGGTFTLSYGGQTTAGIPYNATAAQVEAALLALSSIDAGEVQVTGVPAGPWTVSFGGDLSSDGIVSVMTTSATGLTGGGTYAVNVVGSEGVAMPDGTQLLPAKSLPMDIKSAFKPGFTAQNPYNVVGSVAIPFVVLESLSYRFGISDMASQSATLRGDTLYYSEGATFVEEFTGTNTAGQQITVTNPVIVYNGDTTAGSRYVLGVSLVKAGKRLILGAEYTEAATGAGPGYAVTVTVTDPVPTTDTIRVIYASTQPATFPQISHAAVSAVRPAAIRGRNIEVYIGGVRVADRWTSVQSVNIDYKVTLEKDEEMGNPNAVSNTFDVPDVTGSVEVKPRDYHDLYTKICKVAGVTVGEVAGPLTTVPLPLIVVLHSPDTGQVLKTLEVPDARFTLPGYSGQAGQGQKITVTFNWESDTGALIVYKGARPAA